MARDNSNLNEITQESKNKTKSKKELKVGFSNTATPPTVDPAKDEQKPAQDEQKPAQDGQDQNQEEQNNQGTQSGQSGQNIDPEKMNKLPKKISSVLEDKVEKKKPQYLYLDPDIVEVLDSLGTSKGRTSKKSKLVNSILRDFFKKQGLL